MGMGEEALPPVRIETEFPAVIVVEVVAAVEDVREVLLSSKLTIGATSCILKTLFNTSLTCLACESLCILSATPAIFVYRAWILFDVAVAEEKEEFETNDDETTAGVVLSLF